ncbi:MAG TPA: 4-hydroxy-3-methylbut-2-enyl diphosphate reductase [Dehalococcoidia bacterium]|nr:4-hydroxy-3-methylbut-2-enyl diphosphate reductase [Dehalococcoidia bacterium]
MRYHWGMADRSPMRVILARPRGFCAGVVRAIEIVEKSLDVFSTPVYVRHEIVHNRHVVDALRSKGAIFVEDLQEVPDSATLIFSAHGVSKQVRSEAQRRTLNVVDATCPLVTKVHLQAHRLDRIGYEILLIGHAGHPEVEGTMGQLPGKIKLIQSVEDAERVQVKDPQRVSYVTQTTLSVDDTREIVEVLHRRFPALHTPPTDDICYATQNRQAAVKDVAGQADLVIVIGAANSSNSNRLVEVASSRNVPAYRIESASEVREEWFEGVETVAITAGASAPEYLVQELVRYLQQRYGAKVEGDLNGSDEDVYFPLPKELVRAAAAKTATVSRQGS